MLILRRYRLRHAARSDGKGYGYEVTLPPEWVESNGLKSGDELVMGGDKLLIVAPSHLQHEVLKLLLKMSEESHE